MPVVEIIVTEGLMVDS